MNSFAMKFWLIVVAVLFAAVPVLAQTGNSEIFVFDVESGESGFKFTNGTNVSNSPGYDNQPSFGNDGKSLLFTSIRNGNSPDIYEYHFDSKMTHHIVPSPDSEYTARARDKDSITFVREGAGQEMTVWSYDRKTKKETRAFVNKEPVAYYDWNSKGGALVWIRYAFMARYVVPSEDINWYVSDNVQPSSPQVIPGTDKFSFVYRRPDGSLWIKEFDPETKAVRPIVSTKDDKIDYCWMSDGTIIMGSGPKLFGFNEKRDKDWVELADLSGSGLKDITRLSYSGTGQRIAIVSNQ